VGQPEGREAVHAGVAARHISRRKRDSAINNTSGIEMASNGHRLVQAAVNHSELGTIVALPCQMTKQRSRSNNRDAKRGDT